ncbi:EKC/KEOPS complex subunit LAGE3 [Saccopteryx bilineata]|uniref:EKC/KEOPS complex subunit LAGE3 n=1 Tax=Saccopteryx bilineata TaxID=59482 RepID=UPI00338FDAE9
MVGSALRGWGRRRSTAAMQVADVGLTGADCQSGQDGSGTSRGSGRVAIEASGALCAARSQHASGRGGDTALTARRPGNRLRIFDLRVPFPSPLEADIARGSLAPDAEPHRDAVQKALTVSGSVLAVCWRAEDSRLLRISIINFLDHLSLVMKTMQRFGPPLSR